MWGSIEKFKIWEIEVKLSVIHTDQKQDFIFKLFSNMELWSKWVYYFKKLFQIIKGFDQRGQKATSNN